MRYLASVQTRSSDASKRIDGFPLPVPEPRFLLFAKTSGGVSGPWPEAVGAQGQ